MHYARGSVCVAGRACVCVWSQVLYLPGCVAGGKLSAKVSVTRETGWNTADQKTPAEVLTRVRSGARRRVSCDVLAETANQNIYPPL